LFLILSITEKFMSETPTQELIDDLRRSVRRWKTFALPLLVGLGLVIVLEMGIAMVMTVRARHQAELARPAEKEARIQAEHARREAEAALGEAR
jgi:hypothetical protein